MSVCVVEFLSEVFEGAPCGGWQRRNDVACMDVPEQSPSDRQSALGQRAARRERLTERVDRSQSAVQAPAVFAAGQTQCKEDRHRSAQAVSRYIQRFQRVIDPGARASDRFSSHRGL